MFTQRAQIAAGIVAAALVGSGCSSSNQTNTQSGGQQSNNAQDTDLPSRYTLRLREECPGYFEWQDRLATEPWVIDADYVRNVIENQAAFQNRPRVDLTGDTEITPDILAGLIINNGFYFERIRMIAADVRALQDKRGYSPEENLAMECYDDIRALKDDEIFQAKLNKLYGREIPEAGKITALFLTAYINRYLNHPNARDQIDIFLVEGLVFEPDLHPDGVGHCWLQIGNLVMDPTIGPVDELLVMRAEDSGYVPISGMMVRINRATREVKSAYTLHLKEEHVER